MVSNPMREPAVTVGVGGDASGLNSALDGAIAKLGSLKNAVGLAGAALGSLAVGALAAATSAAADFEQQMVEVEKVTSPETANKMADSIREMASEMPVAQEELAGITAQAGRFGVEGTENMEKFTESVAKMSVATDLSTEEAGEAFARMSTLMDEPISNVENLGNAVNELSNTMATSASEVTNAATRSSGALAQLGLQTDQILALNATMNEVSASSRIAGTRLRRFAQELQDPGKTEDLAAALGMTVKEFQQMREESPNELMQQMVSRFEAGGDAADALRSTLSTTSRQALAGLAQNTEDWAEAQKAANNQLEDGSSLTEEYEAAADTFNSKLQVLKNRVRNVAIQLGNELLPKLTPVVERVAEAVDAFAAFNEHLNGTPALVIALTAAIGGAAAAAAAFAGTIAAIAGAAVAAMAALGPVIAGVSAVIIAFQENIGGVRETIMGLVEDIEETTDAILSAFKPTFESVRGILTENRDEVTAFADAIVGAFEGVVAFLRRDLLPAVRFVFERVIAPVVNRAAEAIEQNIGPVLDELGQTITALTAHATRFGQFMRQIWQRIDDVVVPIIEGLAAILGQTLGHVIDQLAEGIKLVANLIQGDFAAAAGNLDQMLRNLLDFSFDLAAIIGEGIATAVDWVANEGASRVAELVGTLNAKLASFVLDIPGMLARGLRSAVAWLNRDGFQLILSLANDIKSWLVNAAFDFPSIIAEALVGAHADILAVLERLAGWIFDKIKTAVKSAIKSGIADVAGPNEDGPLPVGPFTPFGLPGLASGGLVEESGLVQVHAGERVVQAAQVTDRGKVEAGGQELSPQALASALSRALGDGMSGRVVIDVQGDGVLADVIQEEVDGRLETERRRSERSAGTQSFIKR